MTNLSKYLTTSEFKCKCCGALPPDLYAEEGLEDIYATFFGAFDDIREMFGKAIPINSGYRCAKHNAAVGGEPLSVHTFGLALDMDCKNAAEVEWLAECVERTHDELRMGKYKQAGTFIHCDMGYYIWPRASKKWRSGVRWEG